MNYKPEHLQSRKRVSFTVKGFKPTLLESVYDGWCAKYKAEGINQTRLASMLIERFLPNETKITKKNLVPLIGKYVKGEIKL